MFLRFAYSFILYFFVPLFLLAFLYRLKFYKYPIFSYPLTSLMAQSKILKKMYNRKILFLIRSLALLGLIFLIARPQVVDEKSQINVEGVDIVITIDVSGSMQFFDYLHDRRPRIDVAKDEAIRFIEKRTNDPISIVLFAKDALSRCPLTIDKKFLKDIVGSLYLGIIDPNGTFLGTGLATAVNRLKNSKAKSKIIILLTDGEPSPGEKIDPETAMQLAKEFNVKVYTIGIGNEQGSFIQDPIFGVQRIENRLNVTLLQKIAKTTGGMFFKARNPHDMKMIYNEIDRLEKTVYQTNLFHNYYEAFLTFIWIILALLGIELFLRLCIWRGV